MNPQDMSPEMEQDDEGEMKEGQQYQSIDQIPAEKLLEMSMEDLIEQFKNLSPRDIERAVARAMAAYRQEEAGEGEMPPAMPAQAGFQPQMQQPMDTQQPPMNGIF